MHTGPRLLSALLALLLVAASPLASAEFGPESEDGYPINVDGVVLRPPVIPVVATVVPSDIAAAYAGIADAADPLNKIGPFTAYPYYPLLTAELRRLAEDHPDLVKLTSAGKSTAGLDLWLLEIADHARIESGEGIPLEEREVIYLDGGTHSNEYSGVYFVTEWAQFLLDEYETNETAKWIVENRHTYILPMTNPDGSNLFGRLNAKGVNINRNFPGTWGTVDENPIVNNPGPAPGSEKETQTVMTVLDRIQPDYVNSIHCCGNLWLHPYGAESLPDPADIQMYTRTCDEAFADVREFCGEIWSTIYPASGTTADQGYEQIGASSWTYEMSGRGAVAPWGQPIITGDPREQEIESWNGVLHAFLNVEKYGARPQLLALEGDGTRLYAVVENVGYGNLTAGNISIQQTTAACREDPLCDPAFPVVALPPLAPGERATVEITALDAFEAGDATVTFDFVKRLRYMTPGQVSHPVQLVDEGGRLVAQIAGADAAIEPLGGAKPSLSIPLPGLGMLLAGVAALALVRRRW